MTNEAFTFVDGTTGTTASTQCSRCDHFADVPFEWAPGHLGGLVCDCCIRKVWEETLRNVTSALEKQVMRC